MFGTFSPLALPRGVRSVSFNAENPTGATRLYERAGMAPERVIVLLRRPLA